MDISTHVSQTFDKFRMRIYAGTQFALWHYLDTFFDNVLVTEYPKSGASWYCKMLAACTDLYLPEQYKPFRLERSVIHGVHGKFPKNKKSICVLRDGRDVMVSAYYYFLIKNERNKAFGVRAFRKATKFEDYEAIEHNLPDFIHYMFNDYSINLKKRRWDEFNLRFLNDPNVLFVKYEDMLEDAVTVMKESMAFLQLVPPPERIEEVVDKFSFAKMAKRKAGEENTKSYFRKGIAGDWKNKFTPEACKVFDEYAGEALIKLGYEKDHNWY